MARASKSSQLAFHHVGILYHPQLTEARVMAAVRQAGVTKFGLVAEPSILEGAEVEKTPPPVP